MKLLIATATAALVSTAAFAAPSTIGQDARPNAGAFEVNDMSMDMNVANPASIEASTNDNNSRATAGMDVMASNSTTSFSTRSGIEQNGDAYPVYSR
mgnify:CR=1 FL=1